MEGYSPAEFGAQIAREMNRALFRFQKGIEALVSTSETRVGQTPKDLVYENGTRQLWRYRSTHRDRALTPLLMVHSLVSKPYVLDLYPGYSLVQYMNERGYDVYLLDWGSPREADRNLRLDDYVCRFLPEVVAAVRKTSHTSKITMLGYCLGGTMGLMYAATARPNYLRNLIVLTTPIVFGKLGLFNLWADKRFFDVDQLVDTLGLIPAEIILLSFKMLKPTADYAKYYAFFRNAANDEYVAIFRAMDKWTGDHIPMAGETGRQLVKNLLQRDELVHKEFCLNGRPVDLSKVKCSFLNCYGAKDTLVPREANLPLMGMVASRDKEEIGIDGGHMGIVTGRDASKKLWPVLDQWMRRRTVS